jgi:hypothetical protein
LGIEGAGERLQTVSDISSVSDFPGGSTRPIASPIINTRVWSAIVFGFVRKKKARVMWKSDSEVIIVAAEMSAIWKSTQLLRNTEVVELCE